MTAREVLVRVAGSAHALHSVVNRVRTNGKIVLTCSCGETFAVESTSENKAALKNVMERVEA